MDRQLLGTDPRIYVTNPDEPEEGRVFIYAKTRWYERESGPWGDVVYQRVADEEEDLDDYMAQDGLPDDLTELDPLDDGFARSVVESFLRQNPLYQGEVETSDEPPFTEREVEIESELLHFDDR
jgi:hypothetical protein